jgi:hypothetical protein
MFISQKHWQSGFHGWQIQVGKFSYGKIDASFVNTDDRLIIGNLVSIAAGVKFLLGANHRMDTATTFPIDAIITKTLPR